MIKPTSVTTPSAPDRDEIARRVFAVVCHENFHLPDELDHWLSMIEGSAGFLHMSCAEDDFRGHGFSSSPSEIACLAELLQRSAAIARILATSIREGGQ